MTTAKGGTGTPPHGQITSQGPEPIGSRMAALEERMTRIETLVGETGGQLGELVFAIIRRHNWLEKMLHFQRHVQHHEALHSWPLQEGHAWMLQPGEAPPRLELPEGVAESEEEDTTEETDDESETPSE